MSSDDVRDCFGIKKVEPPHDETGHLICGRLCKDGSDCSHDVRIPYMSCASHDAQAPITAHKGDE